MTKPMATLFGIGLSTKMLAALLLAFISLATAIPVYEDPMINEGLFEGDMLDVDIDEDRNAITKESKKWPEGNVFFTIGSDLAGLESEIRRAMHHIEAKTCIRFFDRKNQKDYVHFFKGNGCYSNWGRTGGMQKISLGAGCKPFGTIVHEILHALGFEHEHNRSDRDEYLNIHWDNILESRKGAFRRLKPEQNKLLTPFDFQSVLLYGNSTFAKVPGMITMTGKQGESMIPVPYKKLSLSDIKRINIMYDCPDLYPR